MGSFGNFVFLGQNYGFSPKSFPATFVVKKTNFFSLGPVKKTSFTSSWLHLVASSL